MNDPAAAKQAFTEVANKMTSLDASRTVDDLPQLKDAFDKAATCQKLDQKGSSSAPPTSTS